MSPMSDRPEPRPTPGTGSRWLPPDTPQHHCKVPTLWPWIQDGRKWQCWCGEIWRADRADLDFGGFTKVTDDDDC